jgi:hypothetical protein
MDGIEKQSLGLQAERAELLVGAGYPAEYLDEIIFLPEMPRQTGYIKGVMCSCLKELYEQERAKDMSCLLKLGKECLKASTSAITTACPTRFRAFRKEN